jgi:hypothetical protein
MDTIAITVDCSADDFEKVAAFYALTTRWVESNS